MCGSEFRYDGIHRLRIAAAVGPGVGVCQSAQVRWRIPIAQQLASESERQPGTDFVQLLEQPLTLL